MAKRKTLANLTRENERLLATVKKLEIECARLRHIMCIDPLTGLSNKQTIGSILEEEIDFAKRMGHALFVVVGDIDHFKRFNDTYGHLAGDAVLRHTGGVISRTMRSYEKAGRYGGEEFLFVLRGGKNGRTTNPRPLAERIRKAVEDSVIVYRKKKLRVTMSFGVAQWQKGENAFALIARADRALYEAKRLGRNRVEVIK